MSSYYYPTLIDTLYGIQDMIGSISGGAPFATLEEISGWIEEGNFPLWLTKKMRSDGNEDH